VALWSANAGAKAVMDALNVAYGETEKRSFVRLNLVALAFTLGTIFALMLALGAVVVAPIVLSRLGLSGVNETLVALARWPILLGLVILGLTILYRYGPSLTDPHWTWLFPGNVIAAVSWLVLSGLFSWYIAHFGRRRRGAAWRHSISHAAFRPGSRNRHGDSAPRADLVAHADDLACAPQLVCIKGMTKSFGGVRALRGVSLEVRPGEVHELLGENGTGKSGSGPV
jgi:ABC-type multidrug transport system fused ATPase/permease subunit